MALNDITFIRGAGGLGRPLAGEDYISGLVFYLTNANLPSGFSITDRVKQVFSTAEAEALGITKGSATNGVLWYHIDEFFRVQPSGQLYIGIYDSASVDLSVIETVQNFANGKIRQIGVFNTAAFATAAVTALQVSATALETAHKPLSVLYAADLTGVAAIASFNDLTTLASKNVTVIAGEDGGADGAALAVSEGNSITTLGASLGAVSVAKVNESIGWIAKFNMTDGTELNTVNICNGQAVKDQTPAALLALKNKGYSFMLKHTGLAGTYNEGAPTSIAVTSDFATIFNNRTMDKAVRGVRTFMLPNISSPLLVNADGSLTEDTAAKFKNDAARALEQMERDEEISAFVVLIDPTQNVLSTSKVVVTIKIVPVGVADQIEINIGFTVALA